MRLIGHIAHLCLLKVPNGDSSAHLSFIKSNVKPTLVPRGNGGSLLKRSLVVILKIVLKKSRYGYTFSAFESLKYNIIDDILVLFEIHLLNHVSNMFKSLNPTLVWVPVFRSGPRCKHTNAHQIRISHKGSRGNYSF